MPQTKKSQKTAAVRACTGSARSRKKAICDIPSDLAIEQSEPDIECTGWTGGVNHVLSDTETDSDDEDWKNTDLDSEDSESDEEDNADLEELEGEDLLDIAQKGSQVHCSTV